MSESSGLLTIGTFFSAFIGATLSIVMDRALRRLESIPLFRIQLGHFQAVRIGKGISLGIENVGLHEIPEYRVCLFHPDRGSLEIFTAEGRSREPVFPQYPQQENEFQCVTQPDTGAQLGPVDPAKVIHNWLHRVRDQQVSAPHFADFALRLVPKNSTAVFFEDTGLGNNIARLMYEDVTGKTTEQKVENVYYRSRAPFWVELVRKRRMRKMFRGATREKSPPAKTSK